MVRGAFTHKLYFLLVLVYALIRLAFFKNNISVRIDSSYLHIFLNCFEYEPTTKTKNVLIPILILILLEMRMLI